MPSLTVTKIARVGGRVYIRFSDKTEMDVDSIAELRQRLNAEFNNRDFWRRFALALWLANDANGDVSPVGRTITIDLQSSTPVVMS